jgi:acyl-CoA synthetase (AMP-forming)/AMP-acid ligase II
MGPADRSNIAAYLPWMAERLPFQPAILFPCPPKPGHKRAYVHYTYRQLDEASDLIGRGLQAVGIGRGVRTALMVKPSLEFFALTFALFKVGAVPVLIDPGIGLKNLKGCLERAQPEAFIGIPPAHAARIILGWAKDSLKTLVTVGPRWFWGGYTLEEVKAKGRERAGSALISTQPDDMAAILFTSGSTGPPKGAVYLHENFATQVESLRRIFDIRPGEVDLPTFPLFSLFDPALGMVTVVPDMDATRPAQVNPLNIIEAIEDFGVTMMFGSPALLNTVGRYGAAHKVKLPSLRRVISAGAPVPGPIMARFCEMLVGDARVWSPYGATESLPIALIDSGQILEGGLWERTKQGHGFCVGKPVDEIELRIIAITDDPLASWSDAQPLPTNQIGEVVVRGGMVTRTYYRDERNTALHKIASGDPARPWHRVGDVGYLDEEGRLWICGRKSQRVLTTDHGTLHSLPCEEVFNVHPDVYRSALVGVTRGGKTVPALCVELEPEARHKDRPKLTQELLALGAAHPLARAVELVYFHDAFPVDIRHNAKIRREALTRWAQEKVK